jgi:hypothetical protein
VPGAGRRLIECSWILAFLAAGFVVAVLAPPVLGIPLAAIAAALAVLNAYVHRALVGTPWLVAAVVFGTMWLALPVAAAVAGAGSGLTLFVPDA